MRINEIDRDGIIIERSARAPYGLVLRIAPSAGSSVELPIQGVEGEFVERGRALLRRFHSTAHSVAEHELDKKRAERLLREIAIAGWELLRDLLAGSQARADHPAIAAFAAFIRAKRAAPFVFISGRPTKQGADIGHIGSGLASLPWELFYLKDPARQRRIALSDFVGTSVCAVGSIIIPGPTVRDVRLDEFADRLDVGYAHDRRLRGAIRTPASLALRAFVQNTPSARRRLALSPIMRASPATDVPTPLMEFFSRDLSHLFVSADGRFSGGQSQTSDAFLMRLSKDKDIAIAALSRRMREEKRSFSARTALMHVCHSAKPGHPGDAPPVALLMVRGLRAAIAMRSVIFSCCADHFATRLYSTPSSQRRKKSFGRAFYETRTALLKSSRNPIYLTYSLMGDPEARFL